MSDVIKVVVPADVTVKVDSDAVKVATDTSNIVKVVVPADVTVKVDNSVVKVAVGFQGINGTDGTDGASFLSGTGDPAGGLGVDGDSYVDVTALDGDTFLKTAGVWNLTGNLLGPTGATGDSAFVLVPVTTAQTIVIVDADNGKFYLCTQTDGTVKFQYDASLSDGHENGIRRATSDAVNILSNDMTVNGIVNGEFTIQAEFSDALPVKDDGKLSIGGSRRPA